MRRSQSSSEHAEAVSRRLATLSAELAAVRGEPGSHPDRGEGPTHTRVRQPVDPPAPVVLPVPGRHASRRLRVAGFQLGPLHLAVVSVVVAAAVALAAWWAVRDQAEPVAVAPASAGEPGPAGDPSPLASLPPTAGEPAGATGAGAGQDAATEVVVDVAGKVRRPGIAVLPSGSRVVDALEAAGGARRGVDLSSLNLARLLVDGEQILVGQAAPAGPAGAVGTPPPAAGSALVNLNFADQTALESLPGVGPVTAGAILAWRSEHGGFTSVDELLEVDGIGEATLAEIAPHVTL
ncbi:helix-hairpin-helix domain-containing protein [Nocardioides okcheonensis]|uniref:helix-hairpin-helix domain-containing protein n=1 Tax=Nocardioides okcheonensis TaxID=2894081 RepID=UPI001E2A9085|nr:helix-hairpin-helix domain-containing protein [Nocardioides okcheonensis]UFN44388.1 helix-hairpin-helix domain-containing protein [Nocardioides okcheonensis]